MLTKIVDGQVIECSAEEEAELLAFWEANDPAKQPPEAPKPTLDDVLAVIASDPELAAKLSARLATKEAK